MSNGLHSFELQTTQALLRNILRICRQVAKKRASSAMRSGRKVFAHSHGNHFNWVTWLHPFFSSPAEMGD